LVPLALLWLGRLLISSKGKVSKPPFFLPIIGLLFFYLLSTVINLISGNINFLAGFFYFLKQGEFFLIYFLVFSSVKKEVDAKTILRFWQLFISINVAFIIIQMIAGQQFLSQDSYGYNTFIELRGPLPSGGFFLMAFIFLFGILVWRYSEKPPISRTRKLFLIALTASPAIGVIASGSRASFMGLVTALIMFPALLIIKRRRVKLLKPALIIIFVSVLAIIFLIVAKQTLNLGGIQRIVDPSTFIWEITSSSPTSRISIWKSQLDLAGSSAFLFIFGRGMSYLADSHSQYTRNLIETGVFGSVFFLVLIWNIIKRSYRELASENNLSAGLAVGLLTATISLLVISVTAEAFLMVKIMEVYWFFAAIYAASSRFSKGAEQQT